MKSKRQNKIYLSRLGDIIPKSLNFYFQEIENTFFFSPFRGLSRLCLFCLVLVLTGCLEERIKNKEHEDVMLPLTVTLSLPGIDNGSTRALTEIEENELRSIDVLVFLDDRQGNETFLYHTSGREFQGNDQEDNKRTFKVTLQLSEGGEFHRLVVLANLKNEIAAVKNQFTTAMTKEEIYELILFSSASAWENGSGEADFRPLPMWGETANSWEIIRTLTGSHLGTIPMLRSVARVDVGLRMNSLYEAQGIEGFSLSDVYVYNHLSYGQAVPFTDHFDATGGEDGKGMVNAPSIPELAEKEDSPQHYWHKPADNSFIREIYLSEINNREAGDHPLYLVLGGYYNDPDSIQKSWYRVDFYDRSENDPQQKRLNILRNHRYLINVTSVDGPGYKTLEEAGKSTPMHMTATVLKWDESALGDIVIEGSNYLRVNEGKWMFPKEAQTTESKDNRLTIETNHPDGWQITKITDEFGNTLPDNWLTTNISSGTGNETVQLILKENTTTDRTGLIYILSGNLSYIVEVTQTTQSGIWLKITDQQGDEIPDTLYFDSGVKSTILGRTLVMNWSPQEKDIQVNFEQDPQTVSFDFNTVLQDNDLFTGGNRVLLIQPPVMTSGDYEHDPMRVKETKVTFKLEDTGRSRTLVFKQEKKGLAYEVDTYYPLDGNDHYFIVHSNATWQATLISGNDIINSFTSSGGKKLDEQFTFQTHPLNDISTVKNATIRFESDEFDPVEIPLKALSVQKGELSNSYIVEPGSFPIQIPVGRANQHNSHAIPTSGTFTAELLWTDHSSGMQENGAIQWVYTLEKGPEGYILVAPGKNEGNAVVAVKVDGKIVWSWHLWVTYYNPSANGSSISYHNGSKTTLFMDRNLGAFSNTPEDVKSIGLHYQWGRKDPFPGAESFTITTAIPLYNASGESFNFPGPTDPTGKRLDLTIENPTSFYITSGTVKDWYSSTGEYDDTLWNKAGLKTIYDPCPEGWRVPVGSKTDSPWYFPTAGGSTTALFYRGEWSIGWDFNDHDYLLGYYPAIGFYNVDGILGYVGVRSYCWSASPNNRSAYMFYSHNTTIPSDVNPVGPTVNPGGTADRVAGLNIRCVRE